MKAVPEFDNIQELRNKSKYLTKPQSGEEFRIHVRFIVETN
ncbi:MAG: hypothetical protein ACFFCQ_07430 [Promethearchaeota archaeon]